MTLYPNKDVTWQNLRTSLRLQGINELLQTLWEVDKKGKARKFSNTFGRPLTEYTQHFSGKILGLFYFQVFRYTEISRSFLMFITISHTIFFLSKWDTCCLKISWDTKILKLSETLIKWPQIWQSWNVLFYLSFINAHHHKSKHDT